MKIYLLRHARVIKEYEGCYNGWIDIDIEPNIEPIKELENINFDFIYSSDLLRSTKTLNLLGFTTYQTDNRIRESKFKEHYEGKNFNQINPPQSALKDMQSWYNFICDESVEEFRYRVESFLSQLKGDKILICSHGGAIRMMLSILEGKDFFKLFNRKVDYLDIIHSSKRKE
jgi:broad specificity phosphatase PhoE